MAVENARISDSSCQGPKRELAMAQLRLLEYQRRIESAMQGINQDTKSLHRQATKVNGCMSVKESDTARGCFTRSHA